MTQPPSTLPNFIAPAQLPEAAVAVMNHKASLSPLNSFLLAILAGAYWLAYRPRLAGEA